MNKTSSLFPEPPPPINHRTDYPPPRAMTSFNPTFDFPPTSAAPTTPKSNSQHVNVIKIAGLGYCPVLVGPKGGLYYMNRNGNKSYISGDNLSRIEKGTPTNSSGDTTPTFSPTYRRR
jgi:hypothetical protein